MSLKHHIAVKFVAIFLAALTLLTVIASAAGVILLTSLNLYEESFSQYYEEQMAGIRRNFAVNLVHRYASMSLGNIPESYLDRYHNQSWLYNTFEYGQFCYVIRNENGLTVESTVSGSTEGAQRFDIQVTDVRYRRLVQALSDEVKQTLPEETTGQANADTAVGAGVETASEKQEEPEIFQDGYYDSAKDIYVELSYQYADLPPYTVSLYLFPDAMPEEPLWDMLAVIWGIRYELFYVLGGSLLILAATAVYLCCAAGRSPGRDEVIPGGLNRIPLDIYLIVVFCGVMLTVVLGWEVGEFLLRHSPQVLIPFGFLAGYCGSLAVVSFLYALLAQIKAPKAYWWHHSVIGWCLTRVFRGMRWLFRGVRGVVRMLPVIWQWLLTAFIMVCVVGFSLLMLMVSHGIFGLFWLAVFFASLIGCIGVICYGAWCFGVLIRGARYMAQGNIYYQIDTRYLLGCFRDFAIQLNSLAGAAQIAAQRQLRSERMKTELITNVSHDIKTPLTSIINYVDLLKMPHSQEENQQYLEVLDRQSQRLKKLVEDLMEMSKASTGNMSVDISRMDAAETINQALGEFSDKLDRANLIPVFRTPENPVYMLADGRLVWRVMSNLLSNAVKYAMPGTRLYLDLMELEGRVIISMKNISREELNVRADELLERFVRGDASRNTEGSGLGLNIAQSLMELQKGQLQLLVDGDLFKVTLVFPAG